MIKLIFASILLLLQTTSAGTNDFIGTVISVSDGDTITVLREDKTSIKIRLEGIDCPEAKQDFGTKAKQATSQLCYGKNVRIVKSGEDRYGRTLAMVYVSNQCVNEELIRQGMAWHYKKYNKDPELARLENQARAAKVGLWAMENAVAPWEFRSLKK